jgi:hypothetical protein
MSLCVSLNQARKQALRNTPDFMFNEFHLWIGSTIAISVSVIIVQTDT